MKTLFILLIASICNCNSQAQQTTAVLKNRIDEINKNIYKYFYDADNGLYFETDKRLPQKKPHSYLWPLCALIQAANEQESLQPSMNFLEPVMKAIEQYYSKVLPAPAYQAYVAMEEKDDRFYDDNQWIAIACIDKYNRDKEERYLDIAEDIYRFMMTGYDAAAGGGIYWKEGDKTTKNTCSNGPGILIALQLYKITHEQHYLDTALILYKWVNAHLQAPSGLYYDNIKIPSLKIDSALYSYNTGTMLQSNVLLYNITGNKNYLQEAIRIADAAQRYFYKNNKLPGNYWFNAVLLRGYEELYKVEKDRNRLKFFEDDAERIWKEERDENALLGKKKEKSLIDQAAMIEIYAKLSSLNSE